MYYFLIVGLSLLSCVFGFHLETIQANIRHIQNGRLPNAGAALLPTILMIPLFYFLAAWGLNQLAMNLGYLAVALYALASNAIRFWHFKIATAELKTLKDKL